MRCDFCDSPDPVHVFEAADSILDLGPGPLHHSVGAWAACAECSRLIERGDRDGLVQRGFEAYRREHPEGEVDDTDLGVLELLRVIHLAFWEGREIR